MDAIRYIQARSGNIMFLKSVTICYCEWNEVKRSNRKELGLLHSEEGAVNNDKFLSKDYISISAQHIIVITTN